MKERPIVIVSSSVVGDEMDSMLSTGANEFIAKPIREVQIWGALERLLGLEFVREEPESEAAVEGTDALTREHIALLPPELIGEMRDATSSVDFDRLRDLVDEVVIADATVARGLRKLLREYDYAQYNGACS